MVTDLWLAQDGIAEGHAIVIDMEGSTLSHLARVNIIAMKKFMYYIQVKQYYDFVKVLCFFNLIFLLFFLIDFFYLFRKLYQFA